MSFVINSLNSQFEFLLSAYVDALAKNKQANEDARKIFNRDPVQAQSDDIQKLLNNTIHQVYISRQALLKFVVDNKDCIQFAEPLDASLGVGT